MLDYIVAFGLLLAIMLAYAGLVRGAPSKLVSTLYAVFFSMILVGASFPALVEVAPHLIEFVGETIRTTVDALSKVM